MKDLSEKVKETGAEVGIGYDGDADRIGVVDENGTMIFGDKLLAVFAGDMLTRIPGGSVIFDVKCSQGLVDYILKRSGKPVMWKTGHSLLKAKMKELGAPLGGEMSGHMFFAENYYGFDDALFASLKLYEIISRHEGGVSTLFEDFPDYISTPEIRIDCPDEKKFELVEEIASDFAGRFETIDIDGVRVITDDGWGLLRASNTQPVLVLRFEARTEEGFESIRNLFRESLMKYDYVDWQAF
jgi:phosphomannomutase/phosphoglucomutase